MIMENEQPLQSNEYLYNSNCYNDIENNIEEIKIPEFTIKHINKIDKNYNKTLSKFNDFNSFSDFNMNTNNQNYNRTANELYDLLTVYELYNEHLDNIELLQLKMNDYNNLEIYNLNNKILTETNITKFLNKKKGKLNMYLEEILPIIINDAENLDEALTLLTNM